MTSTQGSASSVAQGVAPINYSLGMITTTLDSFSEKEVVRYFERLEQREVWMDGLNNKRSNYLNSNQRRKRTIFNRNRG